METEDRKRIRCKCGLVQFVRDLGRCVKCGVSYSGQSPAVEPPAAAKVEPEPEPQRVPRTVRVGYDQCTDREKEVIDRMMATPKRGVIQRIAVQMGIVPETVKLYFFRAYLKYDMVIIP